MKKKIISLVLCSVLALSLCACGAPVEDAANTDAETTTLANPMNFVEEEELVQRTGIDLPCPENGKDASWVVYNIDGEDKYGEINYYVDGNYVYLRAQSTDKTSLTEEDDFAGLYFGEGYQCVETEVSGRKAIVRMDNQMGSITWLDVVPGVIYSLGTVTPTSVDQLVQYAEAAFVPMQGEV